MQQYNYLVLGLGISGFSAVKYLARQNFSIAVVDSRVNPPYLAQLEEDYPQIKFATASLQDDNFVSDYLLNCKNLVVSPGLAVADKIVKAAREHKINIINDVELFGQHLSNHSQTAKVIGITGSNGKSTVTDMLGFIAIQLGVKVAVGGNIGTPALDLIADDIELYILELSSFQLEWLSSLKLDVATVLNITPDHLDRYASFEDYAQTKLHIFALSRHGVVGRQEIKVMENLPANLVTTYYGEKPTTAAEFHLLADTNHTAIAYAGESLLETKQLKLIGKHQYVNSLSVLTIGNILGWDLTQMLAAACHYTGLPYRCQLEHEISGVQYINDSKATNLDSTIAAITSVGEQIAGKIILLLGGQTKGGDLSPLLPLIERHVTKVLLIGRDAPIIAEQLGNIAKLDLCDSLENAVTRASKFATSGDAVLLSPACASFDMFTNFVHRGEVFKRCVRTLTK
ncbi:UDP-N-acetylmuramoyl-L-alanine--D-glutamate ligase [Gammaproteobacteria bacterium]|nr:UDP-N-acetylmuramoyl-L-alanine--D-glutamate ligase [Gammaproteobacteria bacterium]